ncbi:glycosyltransferase family 39 protein [Agromyces sp. SYSU T00194]|uniref:glycosyltransferase family 39 protein n=1 Tax=Agromyces chitinivorans TaxID=3158560 RepID=UPI0033980E7B
MPEVARPRTPTAPAVASVAVPMLLAVLVALVRASTKPLWRDEYATAMHASLDSGGLARAVSHVDAVLGPYYALVHPLQPLGSIDEAWYRVPSIIAFVVAVGGTALLALRWWGAPAALVGGAVLALNPVMLSQATNARPYAISVAFLVLALLSLDVALRAGTRGWLAWLGYGLGAAFATLLHPFAAVAVATSAMLLFGRPARTVVHWLLASVPAGAVGVTMLVANSGQSRQLAWLDRYDLRRTIATLADVAAVSPGRAVAFDLAALAVVGVMTVATLLALLRADSDAGDDRLGRVRPVAFAAVLLLAPAVVLFAGSWLVSPMLTERYLIWSAVGGALLVGAAAGAAAAHVGARSLAAGMLAVVVATGVLAFALERGIARPAGPSSVAQIVEALEASAAPGDRLVVVQRYWEGGVAYEFARTAGDDAYAGAIRDRAPDGAQPLADLRVVTGVDPLTTAPAADLSGDGALWLVMTAPITEDDHAGLGADLAGCIAGIDSEPTMQVGAFRLEQVDCGGAS